MNLKYSRIYINEKHETMKKDKKNMKNLKLKKLRISNLDKVSIKGGAVAIERPKTGYTYTQCHTNDGVC
jgi:hypothetical protein